jgi:hypothetical protein
MKWHCVAPGSWSKYCNGIPEWEQAPTELSTGASVGGTCKLTPVDCGKCQDLLEQVTPEDLAKISEATLKITIEPESKPDKESKIKTARAKKLEAEIAQRSMF